MSRKVTSSTIGRWMKACISKALEVQAWPVLRQITAHSTRSVATTAAWATQAPIEGICRAVTWSSPSPFIRHYKLEVYASAEALFGCSVLQRVHATMRTRPSLGISLAWSLQAVVLPAMFLLSVLREIPRPVLSRGPGAFISLQVPVYYSDMPSSKN